MRPRPPVHRYVLRTLIASAGVLALIAATAVAAEGRPAAYQIGRGVSASKVRVSKVRVKRSPSPSPSPTTSSTPTPTPVPTGSATGSPTTSSPTPTGSATTSSPAPTTTSPAPTAGCGGVTLYKADGTPWVCSFDDEFNGTSVDTTKWMPVTTAVSGLSQSGLCYVASPNNIYEANGYLYLTARKEASPFTCKSPLGDFTTQYTSGQVATSGRFSQTYGMFSVRASFPAATVAGLQSSLWMWPQNLATTGLHGEMDIGEEYSVYSDRVIPYLHYAYDTSTVNASTDTNIVTNTNCLISNVNAFHVYTLQWTSSTITIAYDGHTCLVDNVAASGTSPFDQPFFLALTQALGQGTNPFDAATTPLPATTRVDWVRAWK